jgi:hypothetical protein
VTFVSYEVPHILNVSFVFLLFNSDPTESSNVGAQN